MANEQNLKPFNSETGKMNQPKSVESRYKNKIRMGMIADAILNELSDEDLREIARGIIDRSKKNSGDLVAMRDTIGEKPIEKVQMLDIDQADIDEVEAMVLGAEEENADTQPSD